MSPHKGLFQPVNSNEPPPRIPAVPHDSVFFTGLVALSKRFIYVVVNIQSLPTWTVAPELEAEFCSVVAECIQWKKEGKEERREDRTPPIDRGSRKGFMLCLYS